MRFHHLGVATESIEDEIQVLKDTFPNVKIIKRCFDPLQEADLCLLEFAGMKLELVASKKVRSYINRGIKIYHICLEVSNIEKDIRAFANKGYMLIAPPKPAVLFDNREVCFLMSPDMLLIELLEAEK